MLSFKIKRLIVKSNRMFAGLWQRNGGEWIWLAAKPVPIASLNRNLWRGADPSINYYVLLSLSGIISTLGLLANSAATIIGAMIVAPLMGPITGIAFAMVIGNRRLLKRASLALVTGLGLTVVMAIAISRLVGLSTLTPEILARTQPNLLDLGVALSAGAAGAFAKSRRGVADALPGVAIAVALAPPLSVIGIGIAQASQEVALGSTLLFLTNLTGIIFSGGLVFLWQRYGSIRRAQRGLTIAVLALAFVGVPLGISLRNLVIREQTRLSINSMIRRRTLTFVDADIRALDVQTAPNGLFVELEVATPEGRISENQVGLVRDFLEQELSRPISLRVRVIPMRYLDAPAP